MVIHLAGKTKHFAVRDSPNIENVYLWKLCTLAVYNYIPTKDFI